MIDNLKYFFSTLIETAYFTYWESYVFLVMILFISIIIRLARIEKKIDEIS